MDSFSLERNLCSALVGPHVAQYETDAGFKHAIDLLVQLLPFMVDGIASQAEKEAASMNAAALEQMVAGFGKPMKPPFPGGQLCAVAGHRFVHEGCLACGQVDG